MISRDRVNELNITCEHIGNPELLREWFEALSKTVAVDFDGVLHPYTQGWVGSKPDNEPPMEGAIQFLIDLKDRGYRIVVFSTRCNHPEGLTGVTDWLNEWGLLRYIEDITCNKPAAVAYVDDRAVPFTGLWNPVIDHVERLAKGRAHGAASDSVNWFVHDHDNSE